LLLPAGMDRDQTLQALRAREVESGRLSYALHSLPQFAAQAREAESRGQRFDHASALAERGIALPLWPGLHDTDQDRVIDAVLTVVRERN
jgi:perosamine synthetase